MSHFYTVVLVPKYTQDISAKIEELLAPYDENIEVEEYDRECFCVNVEAKNAGWKAAENKFGPFNDLKKRFRDKVEAEMPNGLNRSDPGYLDIVEETGQRLNWKEYIRKFMDYADQVETNHPMHNKPDTKCDECNGTGYYRSTYNPNSKWDWWVVGGRWDGVIRNSIRDDGNGGFNVEDEHHQLRYNTIDCKSFLENVKKDSGQYPFAIITPNGEWCEKAKMGYWATTRNDKNIDIWHETVNEILEKHGSCIAVGCDLHI